MTTLFASSVAHALENVCETLTSHDAKDFAAICGGFEQAGRLRRGCRGGGRRAVRAAIAAPAFHRWRSPGHDDTGGSDRHWPLDAPLAYACAKDGV